MLLTHPLATMRFAAVSNRAPAPLLLRNEIPVGLPKLVVVLPAETSGDDVIGGTI